jgi:hypothetical protein
MGVASGGTGLSQGTSGGVLAFTATGTLASSAALTANKPVIGGGAGAVPTVGTVSGTTTEFATVSGALSSGHIIKASSGGDLVDGGTTVFSTSYASTGQAMPAAGAAITLAHSLGGTPFDGDLLLQCTTNNLGYTAGQQIKATACLDDANRNAFTYYWDATNVYIVASSNGGSGNYNLMTQSSGVLAALTNADWQLIAKAWV